MNTENVIIQGRNYLRVSGNRNEPGFTCRMMDLCKPAGFLQLDVFEAVGNEQVLYRTDNFFQLSEYLSSRGMDRNLFRQILENVTAVVRECTEHMLDPGRLVLEPSLVYVDTEKFELRFIYSIFESRDLRHSMKNFFTRLLGNYYSGFGINDERFREWAAREISRNDFTASRMLASWEYGNEPVTQEADEAEEKELAVKGISFIRNLLGKTLEGKVSGNNETMPIGSRGEGMYLTGICSIDTRIPIVDEGITIGRQMLKEEHGLFNSGIGKTHARIYKMEGEVYVTDMGSRNGTYVNGEMLERQTPVKIVRGDIVSFSDEEFVLC
ncbi:MAG TPA: DUF6382 domain-containing protein [Clostridia bacterium]|nr:DUF6382 domain-containing protein [Clostridia bacterium]